jgi:hypothetical protein
MANEKVRLQVLEDTTEHEWKDVGNKAGDELVPVKAKIDETPPTDTTKSNPSIVLGYDGSGNLTTITKTIGATSYLKTLTYDVSNVLTDVFAWTEV